VLASLAPDLDGFGILFGPFVYERFHHVLCHNLLFGVLVTLVSVRWIGIRIGPLALVFASFVAHLVGDYFGSGPGWGISPYLPFSSYEYLNPSAWNLASWQNTLIGACAIAGVLLIAVRNGRTPLGFFSTSLDAVVVDAIRMRWVVTACRWCAERAYARCLTCRGPVCATHVAKTVRLRALCAECAGAAAPVGASVSSGES
jgi:hypothetical protein